MEDALFDMFHETAVAMFYFGAPMIAAAAVIGLLIGFFLAATQIQEQTLPQLARIAIISVIIALFGASFSRPLLTATERALTFGSGLSRK